MQKFHVSETPKVRRDTITSHVYNMIRESIMTLSLKPGQMLSEKEYSLELGVSRTPVRESFIRLDREELLHIYPQRGTFVSKIRLDRIREERFLRSVVEREIFMQYVQNPDEKSILQLKYILDMQKHALQAHDYYAAMQYDNDFHNVFYDETNYPLCKSIVRNYSIDYQRVRLLSILGQDKISEVNTSQHDAIYDAIVRKDTQRAIAVFSEHLQKIDNEMDEIIAKYPDYFVS